MSEERKLSLGEFLKRERERRGLTIEQTSSATKIGLKVLKQLEEDRYSELPALPFVRGFVKNYAKFLGIDGEKLLNEYASFLDEHSRERPKRDVGHSGYAFERPEGEQSKKILWGVMASMLVFGGAVVFVFKPSLRHRKHAHVDKLRSSPGGDEEGDNESPVAEATPVATPSVLPSGVPSVVAVAASPSTLPSSVVPSATPSLTAVAAAQPPSPSPSPEPFIPPKVPLVLAPEHPHPSPTPSETAVAAVEQHPSPTPTPKPTRTKVAVASPTPIATPMAVATPAASPAPGAVAAVDPAEDQKKDPLQSGTNYPPKEVKYRLVLRTKADLWVRYQCDDKKLMKFALKAGKILVLRGKKSVRFQASNPDSITLQGAGSPETLLSANPDVFDYAGNSTVVFPKQDREKIGDLFKVGPALPHTDSPSPEWVN